MITVIGTIIIGFVVGLLARLIKPGDDGAGFIVTTIIGIIGAFVGSFLGRAIGLYQEGEVAGWIMSIIGAIVVIAVVKLVTGKKT